MSVLFLLLPYLIFSTSSVYPFRFFKKKGKSLSPDSNVKSEERDRSESFKGQFPSLKESGPDLITDIMSKYLKSYTPCTRELCKRNTDRCHELVQLYSDRCVAGDCYTLDFIKLIEFPNGFNLLVPNLTQFTFARKVFNDSKARLKAPAYDICKNLYWEVKGNPRSLESFNKKLIRHNLERLESDSNLGNGKGSEPLGSSGSAASPADHSSSDPDEGPSSRHQGGRGGQTDETTGPRENSSESDKDESADQISNPQNDRIVLIESLFNSTLNYLTFIFKHPFLAEHSKYKFIRLFFRWIQRRKLIKMVRNVAKVKVLSLGMRDLNNIIDSYTLYLSTDPTNEHYRLNISYSKIVKHAIIKLTGDKRVGFLMSEYLMRVPVKPTSFCGDSSPVTCYQSVMDYLERCEDGECVRLDPTMLLDGKDPLNVGLPNLGQLDLALQLFTNSRAHKNLILDFLLHRTGRLSNKQFGDLVIERNTEKAKYSSEDHEVLSKYMYFGTINYKVWHLQGRLSKMFSGSVEKPLKGYLQNLVGSDPIKTSKGVLEALFVAYRNYFFQSRLSDSKDSVIKYVQTCFDTLLPYKDLANVIKLNKKNNKKNEEEAEKPQNLYEPTLSFNWEKENLKNYEEGEWTRVDPVGHSPNLRTKEVEPQFEFSQA
ncbi:conserved hypothetical protein [Theileria orientalis strain Shintoku]|uniref:Rhoptry-associated protein n=1 Tax=Theileria orientalis strain Shintoku TaxID=869250 RepID=J4D5U4_THEOR|nr:conserved hypothetical protein [Theileria orientalis strain Shintoku]PVC51921.1 hypothetical protein MACL_00001201 [Theileria orientalis]BAM39180.1 conserved hypothetical protein [Theileria orientalis strain Shintoku]|eukprot:XP_009689481.1 conserved hypothetical protein [Theileria orientalis strain Shintoku]